MPPPAAHSTTAHTSLKAAVVPGTELRVHELKSHQTSCVFRLVEPVPPPKPVARPRSAVARSTVLARAQHATGQPKRPHSARPSSARIRPTQQGSGRRMRPTSARTRPSSLQPRACVVRSRPGSARSRVSSCVSKWVC